MIKDSFRFDNTTYNTANLIAVRLNYERFNWSCEVKSIVTIEFKGGHLVSHDYGNDENKAKEVYDYIRQLIKQQEKRMTWIKCSEQKPEPGQWVLIYGVYHVLAAQNFYVATYDYAREAFWINCDCGPMGLPIEVKNVACWMPLPKPPKEK